MRATSRRSASLLVLASLPLAACSGGSDSAEVTSADTVVETAPVETDGALLEPVDTEAEASDTVAEQSADTATPATQAETGSVDTIAPGDTTAAPTNSGESTAGAGDAVAAAEATLVEWAIEAPTEYLAGEVTFTAVNGGGLPHELVVIAGESYEALPKEDGGKVIEDELATGALIGRTDRLTAGDSAELTVDLAPGNYVLICNLGGGPNSHAGRGQRLDITVG